MKISPVVIYGWPGFELTQGDVTLGLVPDMGGRIMSLKFCGHELFYVPADGQGVLPEIPSGVIADMAAFKRVFGFRIFGGDKTWVAPESDWLEKSPPVDLDAGRYTFKQEGDACVMTSPVCRETGLQVIRRVGFMADGDMVLHETLHNTLDHPVTKGVWNVTQISRPFDVHMPAEASAIRSYHYEDATLPDAGCAPFEKDGWAVLPCRNDVCFKFGGPLREGRIAVIKETPGGRVAFARVFDIAPDKPYAHKSMVEVFNSSRYPYGEVEVHGTFQTIPPGGEASLTQLWRIYAL